MPCPEIIFQVVDMSFAKKITAALLLIAFGLALLPVCTSAATLTVTLSADSFIGPDTVVVHLSVYNDSSVPMTDIKIQAGGATYPIDVQIAPQDTKAFDIPNFYVSEDMIGKNLDFVMTWKENGRDKSTTESVYLTDATAEPTPTAYIPAPTELIEFTVTCDNPRAEKGQKIVIRYSVVNRSDENMTDVSIIDSSLSTTPIVSGKSIAAGQRLNYNYEFTMGNENITTSPILSYSISTGMQSAQGDSITLECVTVDMDVSVTMCEPTENGTEFIVKLSNNGNKPIYNVRISDIDDKQIEDAFELAPSEQKDLSYTYNPKGKQLVAFKVTGKLATGKEYSFESETYTVWEYIDPNAVGIKFTAEVTEAVNKDGYVGIDLTAKNTGTEDMHDISVTEKNMDRIASFTDLAGGGEETQSLTLYIGEARDMEFTLTAYASTGEPFEYTVKLSAQSVSLGKNETIKNPIDASKIDVGGAAGKVFAKVLTVLAILSFISGAGLIVLAVFERQANAAIKKGEN